MTTPETEFTTLDTCRLAEEVGFKTAPNTMTWTMLHKFAMLVREDAMKQIEALQADADRYRALTNPKLTDWHQCPKEKRDAVRDMWDLFASPEICTKAEMDAAIDAAIAARKDKP